MTEETKMILDQLHLMNGKIDHLTEDVAVLKDDVAELKIDVCELKGDVTELKSDVTELKSDVTELKSDVTELKETSKKHDNDLRSLKLMLENEIRPNIRIIAEGHLDLHRKMNEVLKKFEEDELLRIRVSILESDVRILKEHAALA